MAEIAKLAKVSGDQDQYNVSLSSIHPPLVLWLTSGWLIMVYRKRQHPISRNGKRTQSRRTTPISSFSMTKRIQMD